MGYGPRTEELALKHLATDFEVGSAGSDHPPGDVPPRPGLLPARRRRRPGLPGGVRRRVGRELLDLVPDPIVLSEEEALTFCANSVVVGRTVVMPACPRAGSPELEACAASTSCIVDVSEFHKGGGSIRCLTNPLDIVIGRDLTHLPGGRVASADAPPAACPDRAREHRRGVRPAGTGLTGGGSYAPSARSRSRPGSRPPGTGGRERLVEPEPAERPWRRPARASDEVTSVALRWLQRGQLGEERDDRTQHHHPAEQQPHRRVQVAERSAEADRAS